MKKYLPIVLSVAVLLAIVGGVFMLVKSFNKPPVSETEEEEEEVLKELTLDQKPYVELVPGPSCEYTLNLDNITQDPASVEYEIVYKNAEGVTQGASGTIKPEGKDSSTKEILFGSESSGKRRCDPGVSGGTITLRYRNEDGKLKAKVDSSFKLYEDPTTAFSGEILSVQPTKAAKGKFLVMNTIGLPEKAPADLKGGPEAVFTNSTSGVTITSKAEGKLYIWNDSDWEEVEDSSKETGVFISTN